MKQAKVFLIAVMMSGSLYAMEEDQARFAVWQPNGAKIILDPYPFVNESRGLAYELIIPRLELESNSYPPHQGITIDSSYILEREESERARESRLRQSLAPERPRLNPFQERDSGRQVMQRIMQLKAARENHVPIEVVEKKASDCAGWGY